MTINNLLNQLTHDYIVKACLQNPRPTPSQIADILLGLYPIVNIPCGGIKADAEYRGITRVTPPATGTQDDGTQFQTANDR